MAKNTKIEWNDAGFRAILTSDEMFKEVDEITNRICNEATANNKRGGEGFEYNIQKGRTGRWVGLVKPIDYQAIVAASEDKALERALHQ